MGTGYYLDPSDPQIGKKESIADTARGKLSGGAKESNTGGMVRKLWRNWQICQCSGMERPLLNEFHPYPDAGGFC